MEGGRLLGHSPSIIAFSNSSSQERKRSTEARAISSWNVFFSHASLFETIEMPDRIFIVHSNIPAHEKMNKRRKADSRFTSKLLPKWSKQSEITG